MTRWTFKGWDRKYLILVDCENLFSIFETILYPMNRLALTGKFTNLNGRVSGFCAWANCHVNPFNSIVIETIESTEAGNGNNTIKVELRIGITFATVSVVIMNLLHANG